MMLLTLSCKVLPCPSAMRDCATRLPTTKFRKGKSSFLCKCFHKIHNSKRKGELETTLSPPQLKIMLLTARSD